MTVAERSRRYRRLRKIEAEPTWSTPAHITAAVLQAFGRERFCLDPASPNPPVTPCDRHYTVRDDGLRHPWVGDLVWCNPPYGPGELKRWIFHGLGEHVAGRARRLVFCLPARMETRGMRALRAHGAAMFILAKRLRFGGAPDVAPWASVIVALGANDAELSDLSRLLPEHTAL